MEKEKEGLKGELQRMKQQAQESRAYIDAQEAEERKLLKVIFLTSYKQMCSLSLHYPYNKQQKKQVLEQVDNLWLTIFLNLFKFIKEYLFIFRRNFNIKFYQIFFILSI